MPVSIGSRVVGLSNQVSSKQTLCEEVSIRTATEEDVDQLYEMLLQSPGRKLTKAELRRDISSDYKLPGDDLKVILACANKVLIGYLVFHHSYSPWFGRLPFVDDIFVQESYRRKGKCTTFDWQGIARQLIKRLANQYISGSGSLCVFSSSNLSDRIVEALKSRGGRVLRDATTDWSVYRVEF